MLQTQVQEPPVRGEQDLQESREQGFSIFYTSGTTGKPKGVLLTQGNVYEHAAGCVDAYELKSSDSWLHMAPFFHVLDVWAVFGVTFVGGLHVLMNKFRPEVAIDLLHSLRITVTIFTPAMARLLLKNVTANCSFNLRTVSMGGAGVDEQLIRDIMTTFSCDCFVSYGMTEASGRICVSTVPAQLAHKHNMTPEEVFLLKCTCGHPFHHTEIEIRDDAGKPVAHDGVQVGEVWVRGDTLFKEYWGRPEDSRQAFVDGWLASGDLATINQYGYIMIASRKKDMIIVGGENVYPADVELVLKQMEGVHEVAVYGLPDPMLGETVKAAIVLEDAWAGRLTQSDVLLFASSRLARFKGPHSVFFCRAEDIPRTTTGKVKKEALKKADQAGRLNSSSAQDPLLSTDQSFGLGDAAARVPTASLASQNCLPGMRFLCIIEVVMHHCGRRHQALIWKDARLVSSSMQLIFLISGYMLASSYANRGSTWRKVVDFYVQRLSAFYPLYMLSIIMFLPVYFFWADFMDWDSSTLKYLNVVMNLVGLQVWYGPFITDYMAVLWFGYIPNLLSNLFSYGGDFLDDTYDWSYWMPLGTCHNVTPCGSYSGDCELISTSWKHLRQIWIFMTGAYVFVVGKKQGFVAELENIYWKYLTDAISWFYFILWFWTKPSGKEGIGMDSWGIFGFLQLSVLPALFYFLCLVIGHPESLTVKLLSSSPMQMLGSLTLFIYLLHWPFAQFYLVLKYGHWELTSLMPNSQPGGHFQDTIPLVEGEITGLIVVSVFFSLLIQNYLQPVIIKSVQRLYLHISPAPAGDDDLAQQLEEGKIDLEHMVENLIHEVVGVEVTSSSKLATSLFADSFGLITFSFKAGAMLKVSIAPIELFGLINGTVKDLVHVLEQKLASASSRPAPSSKLLQKAVPAVEEGEPTMAYYGTLASSPSSHSDEVEIKTWVETLKEEANSENFLALSVAAIFIAMPLAVIAAVPPSQSDAQKCVKLTEDLFTDHSEMSDISVSNKCYCRDVCELDLPLLNLKCGTGNVDHVNGDEYYSIISATMGFSLLKPVPFAMEDIGRLEEL
ncbi:hypothetical protein CYMTET_30402 [Cymbomonas tetramitiformis]|uniref:Uncharacterized protein n=1 Tax=Cymbomonas tetramitiformis TaxID=36881 RepID=A0AAE0FJ50_9CHLO|nr:hypothetical protein CYMTET_30402 [Cymbomonas tetramitiformis]